MEFDWKDTIGECGMLGIAAIAYCLECRSECSTCSDGTLWICLDIDRLRGSREKAGISTTWNEGLMTFTDPRDLYLFVDDETRQRSGRDVCDIVVDIALC